MCGWVGWLAEEAVPLWCGGRRGMGVWRHAGPASSLHRFKLKAAPKPHVQAGAGPRARPGKRGGDAHKEGHEALGGGLVRWSAEAWGW